MTSANSLSIEIKVPSYLNLQSIAEMTQKITEAQNEDIRFIILKGSKTIFCHGLDVLWIAKIKLEESMQAMQEFDRLLKLLQTGDYITIAMVTGSVSGGGMGIVTACDYVIAEEASTFYLPEGMLGLIPGMILPSLLNKLTLQRIKKMFLTGQKYSSETALEWEIVDERMKYSELENGLAHIMKIMKSCKKEAVGELKQMLFSAQLNKDELTEKGIRILSAKINHPEIKARLINLAEFLEE